MRTTLVIATSLALLISGSARAQFHYRDHDYRPGPRYVSPFERRSMPAHESADRPVPPPHRSIEPTRSFRPTDVKLCDAFDKDADAAIEACGHIVARGPVKNGYSLVLAYTHRGQAYESKNDHDHAITDFSDAIRLKPDAAASFVARGTAEERAGELDRARDDFRKAASLEPKNQDAANGLKRIETRSVSVAPAAAPVVVPPVIVPPVIAPPASPVAGATNGGAAPASSDGKRIALVIGNGKYVNANVLPNPPNDAHAIAGTLREIGFDVQEGANLDRAAMETQFRAFLHKASTASVVLLFYAGHGMQVDGKNYLVPVDAKLAEASDLPFETIEIDKLLDTLGEPGHTNISLLDACRDNPLARGFASRLPATRSAAVPSGLAAYSAVGTGTLIAYATAPGQTALDGQGGNSPFTTSLLHNLRTPGLEIRQVLTRVRAEVAQATNNKQIPWDNSSLMGDVVLVGPTKTADH